MFQLPNFNNRVWLLSLGRLLSQIGTGFTLFYAPIFFVDRVGLSAALVGIGLGSGSLSGVFGRIIGGSLCDLPSWGRKKTLIFSAIVSTVADLVLAFTYNFPTLLIGNLLMGFGVGLYWPATEAAVADLTTLEQRNEAFAITRLADSLGLGLGVILGDRPLQLFAIVNILFTSYFAQIQSTLPLYFKSYLSSGILSARIISLLFTCQIVASILLQLPIARILKRFDRLQSLSFSLLIWGLGFSLVWLAGIVEDNAVIWAFLSQIIFALAMVSYTPYASAFVVDLAPESLRGIYLAINSQCWAIGYFIAPPVGGWALEISHSFARDFWLFNAVSIVLGIVILNFLRKYRFKTY